MGSKSVKLLVKVKLYLLKELKPMRDCKNRQDDILTILSKDPRTIYEWIANNYLIFCIHSNFFR